MLKKKRLSNVDDWNHYNKNIKEVVQHDLYIVFDEDENTFGENLPILDQNLDDYIGKDFIKYLTEKNDKVDYRKQKQGAKKTDDGKEKHLFAALEYKAIDFKGETSKKEENKRLKELFLKLHADREVEEKGTIFTIYKVGIFD